ncbi:TPA: GGDEF domain-containing protein [Klebsiella aerogenes]|nr:GGDEF domain-containing protein [Klebsiella aerogenes]HCR0217831.1 GGDEF domain-containing protein [Klebsiella aerogenes]HCR0960616.1 GGDEF domain-containing protein [Klebsiella aerogenes]HCT6903993.1 GGDEF domain-containing protein [Klebsiella aerogenes]HEM8233088.1 GGDEF domain-containing protein [Klebsiella aerogenes]
MNDESKKYISVIFKEWLPLYDSLTSAVKEVLKNIAEEQSEALAARFYDFIFQDPDIARHLTYDLVQERLSRSLALWVKEILTSDKAQLPALAERQYQIGSIHARIGIPAEAVLRGARQIKAGLIEYIRSHVNDRPIAVDAIYYAIMAINMAVEMMCHAYTLSHYRATKNEEAYRLYSLMDNVPMEYGKQQAALSGWENTAIFNIVSENKANTNATLLSESEFGLWFRHKCVRYFNKNSQMDEIAALISQVDDLLIGWRASASAMDYKNTQNLIQGIHIHCQQIGSQLGVIFSSLSQMQNGKDALTSLLNRRYLPVVLKHEVTLAMEHELPMTVAIIDIDHFKGINDNWGHMVGDRAIKHVAELLSDNIRSSDYIFRYGGEEFLLVLVETGVSEAFTILDRLRKKISQLAFNVGGDTQIPITASIGYAVHSGHPDYNLLLRDADNALYAAKREGRNCVKMHKGRV